MDKQQVVNHWIEGANDALDTADKLMTVKKYHHALFFGHLYLEKIIKAYYVQQLNKTPLKLHDLTKLLRQTQLSLSETQETELDEITSFCIEARYEEEKLELYKKATPEYTNLWLTKIKEYSQWILSLLNQK